MGGLAFMCNHCLVVKFFVAQFIDRPHGSIALLQIREALDSMTAGTTITRLRFGSFSGTHLVFCFDCREETLSPSTLAVPSLTLTRHPDSEGNGCKLVLSIDKLSWMIQ